MQEALYQRSSFNKELQIVMDRSLATKVNEWRPFRDGVPIFPIIQEDLNGMVKCSSRSDALTAEASGEEPPPLQYIFLPLCISNGLRELRGGKHV